MTQSIEKRIEEFAYQQGADVFGIADLKNVSDLDQDYMKYAKHDWMSAVVVGVRLPLAIVEQITAEEPGKIYSYEYQIVSDQLDRIVYSLFSMMEDEGWIALPIPARGGFPPMGASLLALARAAGIGSLGKNQLITHKRFGSRLRFAAVVTPEKLSAAEPLNNDLCGECTRCIDACPAKAINNVSFQGSDLRKNGVVRENCWNYIKQFLDKPGYGKTICGVCIRECPYSNKRTK